jgi:hypothetical protein
LTLCFNYFILVINNLGTQMQWCGLHGPSPYEHIQCGKCQLYEKKGVLKLALQLNSWITPNIYNSLYLYTMNVNGQITWIAESQFTIYTMQLLVATQLQFCQNNSFSITMELYYNCTHDVMLTSLIIIHLLKSNTWHY